MCGDIFGFCNWMGVATGTWYVEALDTVEDYPAPNVSGAKVEKTWIKEI